jgi:hypothetical protein
VAVKGRAGRDPRAQSEPDVLGAGGRRLEEEGLVGRRAAPGIPLLLDRQTARRRGRLEVAPACTSPGRGERLGAGIPHAMSAEDSTDGDY